MGGGGGATGRSLDSRMTKIFFISEFEAVISTWRGRPWRVMMGGLSAHPEGWGEWPKVEGGERRRGILNSRVEATEALVALVSPNH